MLRSITSRPTHVRVIAALAGMLLLAGLAFAASSPARRTSASRPPAITIAPGARLYVPTARPAIGRGSAWVVFRTAPHVNARLTVVRVNGWSGRSYAASGGANCIRSTLPGRYSGHLTIGTTYRVAFYTRANTGRNSPRKLVVARPLTARGFTARPGFTMPHC